MAIVCEQFANDATTTLASAVGVGDVTINVTAISNFPSLSPYRIMVDNEIMMVTSGQLTTTWFVSRGLEGTTVATHSAGALVSQVFTQASFNAWSSCRFASDTRANLPSPGSAGQMFLAQGAGWYLYRNNGSVWNAWGPTFLFNDYDFSGVDSNYNPLWSWSNATVTAGASTDQGSLSLGMPPNALAGENVQLFVEAVASETPTAPPYTVTAAITPQLYPANNTSCGLVFLDSVSGKFIYYRFLYNDANAICNTDVLLSIDKYDNSTSFNSNYIVVSGASFMNSVIFLRMQDDGTNLNWYFSNDGYNYLLFFMKSRTDYLPSGPDTVGLAVATNSTVGSSGMNVYSWLKM